jgi:predicted enzyme related to lactoylglutathione lyase
MSENNNKVDYVEFPANDIQATKTFYTKVFEWKFEDYGMDYTSFHDGRLSGGFAKGLPVVKGGPLLVIYADDLALAYAKVIAAGGKITKSTFEFPGGRRFHFTDPNGNLLAVWSDK